MADDEKRVPLGPTGQWIAKALRQRREQRGLTYTELADRLAALGRPIARQGLRRIEIGDRRVDVDDLIALARALGVSPVMLVFPLGQEQTTEVLPGQHAVTWDAVKWFAGVGPFPPAGDELPDFMTMYKLTLPVRLYTAHDGLIAEWQGETHRISVLRQMPAESMAPHELSHQIQTSERWTRQLEDQIMKRRAEMRKTCWLPPPLPPELAHLDRLAGETDAG